MESNSSQPRPWLDPGFIKQYLSWEVILFASIVLLAVATRFYDLGIRVMSHDESLHTFTSWEFFTGKGYRHNPMMHGPLQFHLLALSYFLFGDSDFSARIPAALASIASVIFLWKFRRYLGKSGTVIAAGLFVISPFMLYYGRYARNESLVALFGLVNLWALLRYFETGKPKYVYYLAAATALHFTTKETSFIYLAQTLVFCGLVFLTELSRNKWRIPHYRNALLVILISVFAVGAVWSGASIYQRLAAPVSSEDILTPAQPQSNLSEAAATSTYDPLLIGGGVLGILIITAVALLLLRGYGLENLRASRPFDLIVLFGTLVLPHLAAFFILLIGRDPLNYYSSDNLASIAVVVIVLFLISALTGTRWKPKIWLGVTGIFYAIFILFYTSVFTYGSGFFSGLVGSLGYWLEQQGVRRGSQPGYYYFLIQIPLYEYLAALGTLAAVALGFRQFNRSRYQPDSESLSDESPLPPLNGEKLAVSLFGFWTLSSLLAYTIAGEKMPWLTVHIALPMLLLTGWGLGKIAESLDWKKALDNRISLAFALSITFLISLIAVLLSLFGPLQPFSGQTIEQLQITNTFLVSLLGLGFSSFGLVNLYKKWERSQILPVSILTVFILLAFSTVRTAFNAAYVNYDNPTEYLVYAHSARGVKDVIERVEQISRQTAGELSVQVAFDNDVAWPFTWYLRNYTNQVSFGETPTNALREIPILIVGKDNFGKIEPVVGQGYTQFEYIRMWWPNQNYFDLTGEKVDRILAEPELRAGIFDIWWNRDYSRYGQVIGQDFSLENWSKSKTMRLYIRNDTLSQLWDYGSGIPIDELIVDPYDDNQISRQIDLEYGIDQNGVSFLNAPRDIAMSPDGSLFVADSVNHRVLRLLAGEIINIYGGNLDGSALTFNEPWGVAISPDGEFLFVADTWNHRIVKLTVDGEFITAWGHLDQTEDPDAFWGPRDVEIDLEGNLLVSNTGNKRITVFTPDGEYLYQFGSVGYAPGQFDEPVGLAINPETGELFVADTWNQRIQVFAPQGNGIYSPQNSWEITSWYGRSIENKPYLAFGPDGNLYVTDPDLNRVLVFRPDGEFLHYFGGLGAAGGVFRPISVTSDGSNGLWVSDSLNNRLVHFSLP